MPLAVSTLQAALLSSRGNLANQPPMAANDQDLAIVAFWLTGLGPGGASVIAIPGLMTGPLTGVYGGYPAAALIAAQDIASAVDQAAKTLILIGGIYGGHIATITPGPAALGQELAAIFQSQYATPAQVAQDEAKAYDSYTKQIMVTGTGIPPFIPPQSGGIT